TGYGATAMNENPTSTPDGSVSLATIVEDADYSTRLYTQLHELSHTLGGFSFHASWFDCSPDAFTPPTNFDRGCDTAEYSDLIDTTPGSLDGGGYFPVNDALDAALLPGKTFTDPEYGITINAVSASSSGLAVRVTVPTQTCTRGASAVTSPSPNSQSGSVLAF